MEFTAQLIADFLKGTVEGDPTAAVTSVAKIEEATAGNLVFLSNPKYEQFVYTTQATIIIVSDELQLSQKVDATLVRVEDPYASFAKLLQLYADNMPKKIGVSDKAFIHDTAKIGENTYIGHFAVIEDSATVGNNTQIYPQAYVGENVTIGENCIIYSGVKIYNDCKIGNNVILQANTVIGADGFGFAPQEDGTYSKIPQIGNVVIEDNVEIGSNTTIDRATMGATVIKKGAKLDNLIQIAHNVVIGENTVMAAQCGIAGSTKIGDNVLMGGQVGIAGHINITDKVQIGSQSGIMKNITEVGQVVLGTPAQPVMQTHKMALGLKKLPEMQKQFAALCKEFELLKTKNN